MATPKKRYSEYPPKPDGLQGGELWAVTFGENTYKVTMAEVKDYAGGELSAGLIEPPSFVDNGGGIVSVTATLVSLYSDVSAIGTPKRFTLDSAVFTLPMAQTSYVVADYNAGEPILRLTTDVNEINESTIVPVFTFFYCIDETVHDINWDSLGSGLVNKIHQSIVKTQRYRREFGLIISEYGTRNVDVTAGKVWIGANGISLNQILSATTPIRYYKRNAGAWELELINQYNNSEYSDGTNTLPLGNNKYAVNWFYRGIEEADHLVMVLGSGNYSLIEAQSSQPPANLPAIIGSHYVLVGRIIVEKNASTAIQIDSAFDIKFSASPVSLHNDLAGLNEGEYKHLTEAEYQKFGTLNADRVQSENFGFTDPIIDSKWEELVDGGKTTLFQSVLIELDQDTNLSNYRIKTTDAPIDTYYLVIYDHFLVDQEEVGVILQNQLSGFIHRVQITTQVIQSEISFDLTGISLLAGQYQFVIHRTLTESLNTLINAKAFNSGIVLNEVSGAGLVFRATVSGSGDSWPIYELTGEGLQGSQILADTDGTVKTTGNLSATGYVQVGQTTEAASDSTKGAFRYRTEGNEGKLEGAVQTGVGTFEWKPIGGIDSLTENTILIGDENNKPVELLFNHNNLLNKNDGEYQHLTVAEKSAITATTTIGTTGTYSNVGAAIAAGAQGVFMFVSDVAETSPINASAKVIRILGDKRYTWALGAGNDFSFDNSSQFETNNANITFGTPTVAAFNPYNTKAIVKLRDCTITALTASTHIFLRSFSTTIETLREFHNCRYYAANSSSTMLAGNGNIFGGNIFGGGTSCQAAISMSPGSGNIDNLNVAGTWSTSQLAINVGEGVAITGLTSGVAFRMTMFGPAVGIMASSATIVQCYHLTNFRVNTIITVMGEKGVSDGRIGTTTTTIAIVATKAFFSNLFFGGPTTITGNQNQIVNCRAARNMTINGDWNNVSIDIGDPAAATYGLILPSGADNNIISGRHEIATANSGTGNTINTIIW